MIKRILNKLGVRSTVAGIILKNNKVLLTKRSNLLPEGNKWCLPGGHIKRGEKAEPALKREIKEETELNIKNQKFLFYHDEIIPRLKISNIVLVFSVGVSGNLKSNWEVSETKWFNKKEIEKLDLAFTHKEILRRFFKHKKS